MKKNNNKITGIVTLAVVAVLSLAIVVGTKYLTKYDNSSSDATTETTETVEGAIDISSYESTSAIIIRSAAKVLADDGSVDGYTVTVASKGFGGIIAMDVTFDKTGDHVTSLSIKEHKETVGYGAAITEDDFLSQFNGIATPVYLEGMDVPAISTTTDAAEDTEVAAEGTEAVAEDTESTSTEWADGTYVSETEAPDNNGYINTVSITMESGKITEVIWDAYNEAGELKSVLSADGVYVMTETGLTWQEQAMALAEYVIENQSTDITMDADGKTDSITGVSISVNSFVELAQKCLAQASGTSEETVAEVTPAEDTPTEETPTEETASTAGTQIDGISGATISSTAVVEGINTAQVFVKEFAIGK